jgi:hypothetical protein
LMMIIFCVYSLILSMLINIFAPLLSIQYPRLVTPSYILAFGYCLADAGSAGYRILTEEDSATQDVDKRSNQTRAAIATFDTLLWQSEFQQTYFIVRSIVRGVFSHWQCFGTLPY